MFPAAALHPIYFGKPTLSEPKYNLYNSARKARAHWEPCSRKGIPYRRLTVMGWDQGVETYVYGGCDPHPRRSRSWTQLNHQIIKFSDARSCTKIVRTWWKNQQMSVRDSFGKEEKRVIVSIMLPSSAHLFDVDILFRRCPKDLFSQLDARRLQCLPLVNPGCQVHNAILDSVDLSRS